MFELETNVQLSEVHCMDLATEPYCTHMSVNDWCVWNSDRALCENNFEPILFISPFDVAAVPKSAISFFLILSAMILYWACGLIIQLPMFNHLESEKRSKCQIYVYESIGMTIALCFLVGSCTYNIVFSPSDYADLDPDSAIKLVRAMSVLTVMLYMYCIEILTNKLRWSLLLHHISVIAVGLCFMLLLDGVADLAALRCIVVISLYAVSETNVFVQLLLYRLLPTTPWQIHMASAVLYAVSRLVIGVFLVVVYISWIADQRIQNQLNGEEPFEFLYVLFFILIPITGVCLNVAQFQTVKALFYMTNSVRAVQDEQVRAKKQLKSIFKDYDKNDKKYWDVTDWTEFVSQNVTPVPKPENILMMWDILLFNGGDESVAGSAGRPEEDEDRYLHWTDFEMVFEPMLMLGRRNDKKNMQTDTDDKKPLTALEIILVKVNSLLLTLELQQQRKSAAAMQVQREIHSMKVVYQTTIDLPDDIEPVHSVLSVPEDPGRIMWEKSASHFGEFMKGKSSRQASQQSSDHGTPRVEVPINIVTMDLGTAPWGTGMSNTPMTTVQENTPSCVDDDHASAFEFDTPHASLRVL